MSEQTPASATLSGAPEAVRQFLGEQQRILIGGEWVDAADDTTLEVCDPATGEIITTVPAAGAKDVDAAVQAAGAAFIGPTWVGLRAEDREQLVHRLAEMIEHHIDELAEIECFDSGKSAVLA